MSTLGKKINDHRKIRNMTQEELAEKLNVSPQAVSKWENDLSIPDLPTLVELADLFQISLDELVRNETSLPAAQILPEAQRKPIEQLILRIVVDSRDGDRVRVNLPLILVKTCIELGLETPQINGIDALKNIDLGQLMRMIDSGAIGKLVEVDSKDGDHVEIYVE